jgi:hypothetical protein
MNGAQSWNPRFACGRILARAKESSQGDPSPPATKAAGTAAHSKPEIKETTTTMTAVLAY